MCLLSSVIIKCSNWKPPKRLVRLQPSSTFKIGRSLVMIASVHVVSWYKVDPWKSIYILWNGVKVFLRSHCDFWIQNIPIFLRLFLLIDEFLQLKCKKKKEIKWLLSSERLWFHHSYGLWSGLLVWVFT